MELKRKVLFGVLALAVLCLVCLLLFFRRHPPPPRTAKPAEESVTRRPDSPDEKLHHPKGDSRTMRAEVRRRFGVLVWPGMGARALNYSRSILSWMEEWGFQCGFVTTQGTAGDEAPSPLPADVTDSAWNLSDVSEKLNSIVLADGGLPPAEVAAVKEYLLSGGWAIMPTPEGGRISTDVEELLQLTPSRAAMLMAPESPHSIGPLGAEEVRLLVSHSLAPGLAPDQWVEWAGPPGKVLYTRQDDTLPLLCFRRPELPAVRLVALGDGGVVHWNFPLRPGPLIEDTELKAFLGDTLTWLFARANWVKPVQKEGSLKGIVRRKEGQAIPGAKVSAQVYSEWGQPVQSFEVPSSENGEFAFPVVEPAVYWIKAEAEDYYQADMYLLARVKEGDRIEILMEPEGSIFGHAYYGPGEDHPAVGIPVRLAPNHGISQAWEREAATDKNGHFSFDKLPAAQTFLLIARAEGWWGMQEAPVPLEGGRQEIDVHLQTLFTIQGMTVNAVTGKPLARIEVVAVPWREDVLRMLSADAFSQTGLSDEEGRFSLGLPQGVWRLMAETPEFSSTRTNVYMWASGKTKPSSAVVRLCPHARLYGTVFQSSGAPAPGARVTANRVFQYVADDKGHYVTEPITPLDLEFGDQPLFALEAEWEREKGRKSCTFRLGTITGSHPGPYKPYTALLEGACPLDIQLEAPDDSLATVSGVVLTGAGDPVSGAAVELGQPLSPPGADSLAVYPAAKARSDAEGRFAFPRVDDGLWLIRATKRIPAGEGRSAVLYGEKWQTVEDKEPPPLVEVKVAKASIQGKVVQADGTPLRNWAAKFLLTQHTGGETVQRLLFGERGEFSLHPDAVLTRPPSNDAYRQSVAKGPFARRIRGDTAPLPWEREGLPGQGLVRVSLIVHPRGEGTMRYDVGEVRWGTESLIVTFPAQGRVRGWVVDVDTGRGIPGAGVGVEREGSRITGTKTDSEGMFMFESLPEGECVLSVWKDGYWYRRQTVRVAGGAEVEAKIDMWTSFVIRGRLLMEGTGEPVAAEIKTTDGVFVSGSDGRFTIVAPQSSPGSMGRRITVWGEGTDLEPFSRLVQADPYSREVDVGDIYMEREMEE